MRTICDVPERISYYEECNVYFGGVLEDVIARGFDHFTVGYDNGPAIESFLLPDPLAMHT